MTKLILASESERRQKLLGLLGVPFSVEVSGLEERVYEDEEPSEVVVRLAQEKAEAVLKRMRVEDGEVDGCVIIGADTVVSVDGEVLGKPVDEKAAREMIWRLQGRGHEVWTGVCVVDLETGERRVEAEFTKVSLLPMSSEQIAEFIKTGEWKGKAGGYQIQQTMRKHVAEIEGSVSNVVGLPLLLVEELLESLGYWVDEDVRLIEDELRRGVMQD